MAIHLTESLERLVIKSQSSQQQDDVKRNKAAIDHKEVHLPTLRPLSALADHPDRFT